MMASITRSQSDRSSISSIKYNLPNAAWACSSVILPLLASIVHVLVSESRAEFSAAGFVSNSLTRKPAWAAICAMPRPIAPAPATPTVCIVFIWFPESNKIKRLLLHNSHIHRLRHIRPQPDLRYIKRTRSL